MKKIKSIISITLISILLGLLMILGTITACAANGNDMYTVNTKISDVIADPVFGDYGRLIFPVNTGYYHSFCTTYF